MSLTVITSGGVVQVFAATETRTMTLAQYLRHKRDANFDAAMKVGAAPADKTALDNALAVVATKEAAEAAEGAK